MSSNQLLEDLENYVRIEIKRQYPSNTKWHRGGFVRQGLDRNFYLELYKDDLININSPQEKYTYGIDLNDPNRLKIIDREIANFFK
ncbi:TPA: hypothetical protein NJY08_004777 [Salmonella enterica subsp. enterica serovar Typhi str. AG3]|nr:hypothetical protein [Salmonella enterica subsp. enterica serovar Typhi str. AG3]